MSSSDRTALLEMRGITKRFPGVVANDGIDLTLHAGEVHALLGENGAGKTTLTSILYGLQSPDAGEVRLDGRAVDYADDDALALWRRRHLGFVFQAFHLLPRETALSNVELPLVYAGVRAGERRRRALEALDRVGLADRARHLPSQLSGGQQQRVSLARAIVQSPPLLLADEPTGALDSTTSLQVLELLGGLHREGMTIVIVTHDRAVASYAGRMITFADGQVLGDVQQASTRAPRALEAAS